MSLYGQYQSENERWDDFVKYKFGSQVELVSISKFSGNWRIYRLENKIIKIRVIDKFYRKTQTLEGEYEILYQLKNVLGFNNLQYGQEGVWEFITYSYIPGKTLENLLRNGFVINKINILLKILRLIVRINLHGVAHRDLKTDNILVMASSGKVHIIDFDQAIRIQPLLAIFIDIFGIKINKMHTFFCFITLCRKVTYSWFPPGLIAFAKRLYVSIKKPTLPTPVTKSCSNPDLEKLERAWLKGAQSDASSPRCKIAYYSFDIAGCHFEGERPWELRWRKIYKNVNFKNKRVIELGCNLGLFSAFARGAGACKCVGVDHDSAILESARLVSEAFHFKNEFYLIDFDYDESWEEKLRDFDLVIALSVINWLKNRKRFLKFLGQFNELLYEGHDSIEMETARLQAVGFNQIKIISVSERGRSILLASKSK